MAVNKVNFGSETLIDLTEDTVTPDKMLQGTTAHSADGEVIEGTLTVNNFRTGTSEPDNSLGNDGDWYLVTEG